MVDEGSMGWILSSPYFYPTFTPLPVLVPCGLDSSSGEFLQSVLEGEAPNSEGSVQPAQRENYEQP